MEYLMTGYIVLESVLAVLVISINLLVCTTVYLHKEMRSLTSCLIACLAVADLGVGALGIPFSVMLSLRRTLCFYTCLFMACFPLVTAQFSVLVILVIAVNTHLKTRLRSRYQVLVNKRRLLAAVFLCWLASVLAGFTPLMGWNRLRSFGEDQGNRSALTSSGPSERSIIGQHLPYGGFLSKVYVRYRRNQTYAQIHASHLGPCSLEAVVSPEYLVYFHFLAGTLLPLVASLALYTDLFFCQVRGQLPSPRETHAPCRPAKRRENRTARTLLLMLALFSLCSLPRHLTSTMRLFRPTCSLPSWLPPLTALLSHLNSLACPLLYAARRREFGAAMLSVLGRGFSRGRPSNKVYPRV
ncbi:adenosine receptor A1-like [Acipenser oxyrinchus oxyrinchus]|uniref:Adenosine receptor A1-like n=1 Tax=Acipenser oxyrinchus oxyrinchus TaxID=40147 RepID=A0AAD8CKQ5_ACIOX|nr:adenosine receptor A1-like [Acipenser oxyrinchus oxyrinchus]